MSSAIRSEVFLKEDIQSLLVAIEMANSQMAQWSSGDPREVDVFRLGFRAALESVATALHVNLDHVRPRAFSTAEILNFAPRSIGSVTNDSPFVQLGAHS